MIELLSDVGVVVWLVGLEVDVGCLNELAIVLLLSELEVATPLLTTSPLLAPPWTMFVDIRFRSAYKLLGVGTGRTVLDALR